MRRTPSAFSKSHQTRSFVQNRPVSDAIKRPTSDTHEGGAEREREPPQFQTVKLPVRTGRLVRPRFRRPVLSTRLPRLAARTAGGVRGIPTLVEAVGLAANSCLPNTGRGTITRSVGELDRTIHSNRYMDSVVRPFINSMLVRGHMPGIAVGPREILTSRSLS